MNIVSKIRFRIAREHSVDPINNKIKAKKSSRNHSKISRKVANLKMSLVVRKGSFMILKVVIAITISIIKIITGKDLGMIELELWRKLLKIRYGIVKEFCR